MPKFKITAPDGKAYVVTAPDGATQEQVLAYAQQHYAQQDPQDQPAQPEQPKAAAPESPSLIDQVKRAGQMGLRNVAHGVMSIPGIINDPIVATLNYGEQKLGIDPKYRFGTAAQATDAALNGLGVPNPQPQNATERVVGRVESGLGSALTGVGLGNTLAREAAPVVSSIGRTMASNVGNQFASAATGAAASGLTAEAGGGPVAQFAAGLLGGIAPSSPQIAGAAARGIVRGGEAGRQSMLGNIADFERAGTAPTMGQAAQNGRMQGLESLLAKAPGSAGVMRSAAENQAAQVSDGLDTIASKLAPHSDPARVGRVIERGVTGPGGFMDRFKQTSRDLYGKLDAFIPADHRMDVSSTKSALEALTESIPGAPKLSQFFQNSKIGALKSAFKSDTASPEAAMTRPDVAAQVGQIQAETAAKNAIAGHVADAGAEAMTAENSVRRALGMKPKAAPDAPVHSVDDEVASLLAKMADGKLPYEAVKKLRTLVGGEIENVSLASDVPRSKWKALYGALSQDLKSAAEQAGPGASKAFNRASNHYSAGTSRIDALSTVLDKSGGPEAIYNAATSGTRDGATTLRTVMQSLKPDEQKVLASTMIRRLGKATAGQQNAEGDQFSMSTFLTNWSKLSPQAKATMFDRFGKGFRSDMDAVARMASNVRQGSKVFANPSGSASSAAQLGTVGAFIMSALTGNVGGAAAIAGGAGTTNAIARLMTSPRIVKIIAQQSKVPLQGLVPVMASIHQEAMRSNDPDLKALDAALRDAQNQQQGNANKQQQQ